MNKNDIVELEITALTNDGSGIGRYEGMAVFVPLTAVGDVIRCKIVKALKSYAYGIIDEIIKPSPDRIEADCPAYSKCGGCVFRHISYEAELRAKEGFVRDSFMRIGKFNIEPESIIGCKACDRYRNKSQLPVSSDGESAYFGFFSARSHRVIKLDDCLIQPEVFTEISKTVIDYVNVNLIPAYDETAHNGLLRHIYLREGYHSNEIILTLVVTKASHKFNSLVSILTSRFPQIKSVVLNINPDRTNVILGCKDICLYGDGYIMDEMCGKGVVISPHSFYQVNTPAAEGVYSAAAEYADFSGDETLLDLYCGIGTVGLSMVDRVKKLIGVESVPQAIENAKISARRNGVKNAEFICGDAGKISEVLADRGASPDVIIVDPPRKGCDINTLNAMLRMSPKKIVYISCNHATAARDSRYLCDNGYELVKYRPMDMFPRTGHVETVVLMSRKDK